MREKPVNNPVLGVAICPFCKSRNPIIWAGNFKHTCFHCNKKFNVHRQKLLNVQSITRKK